MSSCHSLISLKACVVLDIESKVIINQKYIMSKQTNQ